MSDIRSFKSRPIRGKYRKRNCHDSLFRLEIELANRIDWLEVWNNVEARIHGLL